MPDDYIRGKIGFPGILGPISASYTLNHGTDPGRIVLNCLPQKSTVFQDGPFTFQWQSTIVRIPDCRILSDRVSLDGNGFVVGVEMEDYRWKWRFPVVNGEYNVKNAYQSVYRPSKKNPQQLAKIILNAMGVPDSLINASGLPTDDYPWMNWFSTPAASELSSLAERYGCRVVPWPDGRVNIFKLGDGNPLPLNLPVGSDSAGVVVPAGPDRISVHFGPTKYRAKAKLEPVGIEVTGEVKPIDLLSYAPPDGWYSTESTFHEVPGTFPKLYDAMVARLGADRSRFAQFAFIMDLAKRSIFKWYRIKNEEDGDLVIPGFNEPIRSLSQILPIDDSLQNVNLDPSNPAEPKDSGNDVELFWDSYDRSVVWGEFVKYNAQLDYIPPDYEWESKGIGKNFYNPGGFSLDRERGLVMFDDYVYSLDQTDFNYCFPNLAVSFMCSPKTYQTREFPRYKVERDRTDIVPSGTQPLVVVHPEFQMIYTFDINDSGKLSQPRQVNKKLLDKVGNYYIDAELRKFRRQNPRSIMYNGLWPIYTDGAIREVTFSMNPDNGMETTACYNDEVQPYVLPYETRRRNQRAAADLRTDQFKPPVFQVQPQTFPYNLGSSFVNAAPSRR